MKTKKCWWIFNHDWSKWEYGFYDFNINKNIQISKLVKGRICKRCKLKEFK